jgi:ferredoxin
MIPKLCDSEGLKPFGSCRLCLVEIEGRRGYPSSCTTPAEAGMKVRTQSPQLAKLRRNVMELYISDHPLDCLTCAANGDCELQDMAGVVGLRDVRYGMAGENHFTEAPKDESNPYFSYDPAKCIVCNRCVRACEETQGSFAMTITGAASARASRPGRASPSWQSDCVSCGACVKACPTATLVEKTVIDLGQAEHSVDTTCAYCGVGCGFRAEMKGNQVVRMVPADDGPCQRGPRLRQGPLRLGLRDAPRSHHQTDDPGEDQRSLARGVAGRRRWRTPRASSAASRKNTVATRSAPSSPAAAPTKKTTWCRSWCAPPSATTMSTPAPASAIRRPATASSRPWASRPARRPSSRSSRPMSSS